jgi:Lon protease-like protein
VNDDQAALASFNGVTRLFPLPSLVLLPGVVQGLHIFETRYRQLMADSLATDMLFSLVLLKPGWEEEYDQQPPIESVGCLGRVAWYETLPDGRFNLRLRSLSRVQILEELSSDRLYRLARVKLMPDIVGATPPRLGELRRLLADAVLTRFPEENARRQLLGLFDSETTLGHVCDVLTYALPLPLDLKQKLLSETNVERRAYTLTMTLAPSPAVARKFPADFSEN